MADIVEIATQQIEAKYKQLKDKLEEQHELRAAIDELTNTKNNLIRQLEVLQSVKVPTNLIDLYTNTGGRVWVSKRVFTQFEHPGAVDLTVSGRSLGNQHPNPDPMEFPRGLYRFVVIAVPQEPDDKAKKRGEVTDDYGSTYPI